MRANVAPYRRVPRAFHAIFIAGLALAVTTPSLRLAAQSRAERAARYLQTYHDLGKFNGSAVVVDGGEVLFRGAFGFRALGGPDNDPATRFRIGSLTKRFTAALVVRLAEEGLLSLDRPVHEILREHPLPRDDRVTVHHLLSDSSGIQSFSDLELLGRIVERVSGEAYPAALQRWILDPLGLHDTGHDVPRDPSEGHAAGYRRTLTGYEPVSAIDPPVPHAGGVLYSTVDDLHRWLRALTDDDPAPFASAATAARMLEPGPGDDRYGLFIRRRTVGREDSVQVIAHEGGVSGFTSVIRIFPDHGRSIVLLDNTASDLGAIAEGLTNLLWGAEAPTPRPSIAERLLPIVESAGPGPALERYRDWRRTRSERYDFGEDELLRLASHFRERGEDETARRILETQLEIHPDAAIARRELADLFAAAGDTAAAGAQLEAALRYMPGDPDILSAVLDLGIDPPPALRIPVRRVDRGALGRLVGSYRIDPATSLEIELAEDGLTARRTGEAAFPLHPQSETTFLLDGTATQLVFQLDGDGASAVSILEAGRRLTFPREVSGRAETGGSI